MAIDTRNKRASLILMDLPFGGPMPTPDGTVDAGDRAHILMKYRGFFDAVVAAIWRPVIRLRRR